MKGLYETTSPAEAAEAAKKAAEKKAVDPKKATDEVRQKLQGLEPKPKIEEAKKTVEEVKKATDAVAKQVDKLSGEKGAKKSESGGYSDDDFLEDLDSDGKPIKASSSKKEGGRVDALESCTDSENLDFLDLAQIKVETK